MALSNRTEIEDELLRQNVLRNISVHRINLSDKLVAKINSQTSLTDVNDLKEVTEKVYLVLQE